MAPRMKNAPSPLTAVFGDAQFGTVSFNSGDDEGKCKAVDQEGQTEEIQVNHGNTQTRSIAVAEAVIEIHTMEAHRTQLIKSYHSSRPRFIWSWAVDARTDCVVVVQTQTDRDSQGRADPEAFSGFDDWKNMPAGVERFLIQAGPLMVEELDRSDASQAFLGYTPLEEGGGNNIALHLTLSCDLSNLMASRIGKSSSKHVKALQVTGVDWSPTGSVVMASFGRIDIVGWCELPGALATWNIFRRGFGEEQEHAPDLVLDHSSCLMCVSCHPVRPAVVAAGSFNGEIIVWDIAKDEPLLATTKIDDLFHREPVTALSWVYSAKDGDYRLAAVSGDGKLLFWSLKNDLQWPVEGYWLPGAARKSGPHEGARSRSASASARAAGCTSVSFLREGRHVTSAVVGTEGGAVVKCRLVSSTKKEADEWKDLRWTPEAEELLSRVPIKGRRQLVREVESAVKDSRGTEVDVSAIFQSRSSAIYRSRLEASGLYPSPGLFRMENHHGPVHAIDCSPFHRALLLSCGADGCARLYNTLQSRPVFTFEPSNANVMDVKWSRARPLVFTAVTEDGGIYVYDLLQSSVIPVTSSTLPERDAAATATRVDRGRIGAGVGAVYSVSFNPKQRDLLATGDSCGRVLIWRMSWRLANKHPGEEDGIERLFKGSVEEDSSVEADLG